MQFSLSFIEKLRTRLQQNLPGVSAQFEMAPVDRRRTVPSENTPKQAAVVALLYPNEKGKFTIAFMERAKHEKDKHSGQISFPGGQLEREEEREDGALRELEEEFGVPRTSVELVGSLTDLYIPVSNFMVYPFVVSSSVRPNFQKDDSEVESILEVNLSELPSMKSSFLKNFGGVRKTLPCFKVQGHIIWGATAMILNELLAIVADCK